jgi:hypothetical protein
MTQCPYSETITDWVSGEKESNALYFAWHEGYEAHKLELITKVKFLEMHISDLAGEIRKMKELRKEIEKQRANY